MTPEQIAESALWAQWVGALAALGGVVVAVIFGILTFTNTRRSKDTQQRATLVAADKSTTGRKGLLAESAPVQWVVHHKGGEAWFLVNEGTAPAHSTSIEGLTDLDKRRLTHVVTIPETVPVAMPLPFTLVSRFSLSGPANIVVTYIDGPGGKLRQTVLLVPAE